MSITKDELIQRAKLVEDSAIETKDLRYKGDQVAEPHRHSMADELAAMANAGNGVFLFGMDDKTKSITGIPKDKLEVVEAWLRNICNDLIEPQLFCRIQVLIDSSTGEDKYLIRVDVPRSLFVHKSPNGYFMRIGSSKREMTPEVLFRLAQQRSQARIIRFDEQSVNTETAEVLDKQLWQKFRTNLSPKEDVEFLLKLKLLTLDEDENIRPSISGILMATQQPQEILSNAYIQAVAYRGTERNSSYQLDAQDIYGPLDEQIFKAYQFVEKNMRVAATKEAGRKDLPQYSMKAIFEALVNAVAHRDYSIYGSKIRLHMFADRLELFSPGTIPNTMTVESLPLRQSARNELLTSLLARCKINLVAYSGDRALIMDRRGEGVPIILLESEKLSGKKPIYKIIDNTELMLTIYATPDSNKG